MAGLSDRRSTTSQSYRFGAAAELDGGRRPDVRANGPATLASRAHPLDHGLWQCRRRARQTPLHGRTWAHLRTWWASRDRRPGGAWHGLRCRYGGHDVRGGQQVQLGSRFVNVERCCVRCGAVPAPPSAHTTAASGPAWPGLIR